VYFQEVGSTTGPVGKTEELRMPTGRAAVCAI
jgi:hypothetical protein